MLVVQPLHQRGSLVGYPGGGHRGLAHHAEGDRTLEVRRRPLLVDPLRQLHGPRPMRSADGRAGRVSGGPRAVRVARHQDRLAAASCAAADRVSRRRPRARRRRRHRPNTRARVSRVGVPRAVPGGDPRPPQALQHVQRGRHVASGSEYDPFHRLHGERAHRVAVGRRRPGRRRRRRSVVRGDVVDGSVPNDDRPVVLVLVVILFARVPVGNLRPVVARRPRLPPRAAAAADEVPGSIPRRAASGPSPRGSVRHDACAHHVA